MAGKIVISLNFPSFSLNLVIKEGKENLKVDQVHP